MNKSLSIALIAVGGILIGALIFGAGLFAARLMSWPTSSNNSVYSMMGNGTNMMGGYQPGVSSAVKTLTVDQAKQAVEKYLAGINNSDLELKEIMIFDNNAYARITEKSTGIGAMELLVDPVSLSVFPEYGPNMMWNLKYGQMSSNRGMMGGGGMMGGFYNPPDSASATMTVTSEQAIKIAQKYLDQQFPGYLADTNPDPFYGYYTIDILKDGQPTGMLSVNGFTGQVFLHTWHGTFIESWE
jgi:hypothetical protein